jgi:hypothetical protein
MYKYDKKEHSLSMEQLGIALIILLAIVFTFVITIWTGKRQARQKRNKNGA